MKLFHDIDGQLYVQGTRQVYFENQSKWITWRWSVQNQDWVIFSYLDNLEYYFKLKPITKEQLTEEQWMEVVILALSD